ncbi:MAG: DUF2344 domain-containing protein [Lachnospiraceae bacterium]|nr:DUF2344 domain-containing protein [Lachnospiraceae bacterium]
MKVRVKFSKTGSMKFIGHLDVMRYFQKAIRRSGIDIAYSQGFNPHQLISFAAPLGVGLTSDSEYMDMELKSSFSSKEAMDRLNAAMNDEIRVESYVELEEGSKNAMSIVAAADYCISLKDGYPLVEDFQAKFDMFLTQPEIIMRKKTKKSEKEVNIKPYIYHIGYTMEEFSGKINRNIEKTVAQQYENGQKIYMQIATGSVVNIKPELVMEAFYKYMQIPFQPLAYQIHRMEVYGDLNGDSKVEIEEYGKNRKLVSLEYFGHVIN